LYYAGEFPGKGVRNMKNKLLAIFVMGAMGNAVAYAADGGNFYMSAGFDYSSGKYGSDTTTTILSIPVIGMYLTGDWMFRLTVPYVRITGNGTVIPGMGGAVPGSGGSVSGGGGGMGSGNATASTTQSGLGDVIAAATYNIYSGIENALRVDLTGKFKFATADIGLGTGENDYAAQVDVYKGFDSFTAMGSLGYQVLGDSPLYDLSNAAYGIFGGYYQFTEQTGAGAEMRVSQKLYATGEGPRELTAYVTHQFDKNLKINAYVLKGFSDGSPDSGFGMLLTSDF
jgi:hypothetical protein